MFAILTNFVFITLNAYKKHLTNQGQGSFLILKYFKIMNYTYTLTFTLHNRIKPYFTLGNAQNGNIFFNQNTFFTRIQNVSSQFLKL